MTYFAETAEDHAADLLHAEHVAHAQMVQGRRVVAWTYGTAFDGLAVGWHDTGRMVEVQVRCDDETDRTFDAASVEVVSSDGFDTECPVGAAPCGSAGPPTGQGDR